MYFIENYPKMSHLLKKLAFTKVYILESTNQVTVNRHQFSSVKIQS